MYESSQDDIRLTPVNTDALQLRLPPSANYLPLTPKSEVFGESHAYPPSVNLQDRPPSAPVTYPSLDPYYKDAADGVDGPEELPEVAEGDEAIELFNDSVASYSWQHLTAVLEGKGVDGGSKMLLDDVSGVAKAGELVAIMGPSGSGKTMLLNRLAHRVMPKGSKLDGAININSQPVTLSDIRAQTSYVEQQDHLIGSIKVKETLMFAAKFGLKDPAARRNISHRIDSLLSSFGLSEQADMIIGTPLLKGLSGGQKRRVSVASQLIASPRILFLDEPTSGLDSVASFEVISYLKQVCKRNKLIVIASIHQPSTSTFNLFDKVYLLTKGRLAYGGPLDQIENHFSTLGLSMPLHTNPAEWLLELVDTDFHSSNSKTSSQERVQHLVDGYRRLGNPTEDLPGDSVPIAHAQGTTYSGAAAPNRMLAAVGYLLHRNFLKSYRDPITYWVRVAMYTCLAILMGTCWLRLNDSQESITPRITAIFFSGAFLSFMAVAYIPAFIEDHATYAKERSNGLYGPTAFMIANFITGIPYLFIIVIMFSVISYWLINFWPTAQGFWTFVGFLFLDLLAAESLVVLLACIFPNFIISLTLVAFANGLWMCVNGFMVPETVLNVFWRSWVTKIDYQSWVFQAQMWNEFHAQSFKCAAKSVCAFPPNPDGTTLPGTSVLAAYGYHDGNLGAFAGYMIAIMVVYRLLALGMLYLRK